MFTKFLRSAGIALAIAAGLCQPASAHAVFQNPEAKQNASYRAVVMITHGCDGSATKEVSVTIPEGAIGARPLVKPGWTIVTKRGAYARGYPFIHGDIKEGVQQITWSGASVADDEFDEFTFLVRLSDAFQPGTKVFFPVEQICETGAHHWTQIPAQGQDAHSLKEPAPAVLVLAAEQSASTPAPIQAGALAIETPWLRATPSGAPVAGGYVTIKNTGSTPDRLVGVSLASASQGEIHEMKMDGDVMRMHAVDGLDIPAGGTLTLKPGGYHFMFKSLTADLKEGESVQGSLIFAHAGKIDVTFRVLGLAAQGPAGDASPHMH